MITLFFPFGDYALFFLRVMVAVIFLAHGWPKIKDLKTTGDNFTMMGFKPGRLWGTLIALLESAGGTLLLIGLGTQALAPLFAIEMAVAAIWKKRKGMKLVNGYELDLLLMVAALVLMTRGGGAFGFDSAFRIW
ncbi:MAG: DoxX family protein [Patescibacteria group bacterium]|nr:DoxX family protein [Patescibacteria group bacterium]